MMISPGRVASPDGIFSAQASAPTTLIGRRASHSAFRVPSTAAEPPISNFISSIAAPGLIEIPPESKVTPLPTKTIGASLFAALALSSLFCSAFLAAFLLAALVGNLSAKALRPPATFALLVVALLVSASVLTLKLDLPRYSISTSLPSLVEPCATDKKQFIPSADISSSPNTVTFKRSG